MRARAQPVLCAAFIAAALAAAPGGRAAGATPFPQDPAAEAPAADTLAALDLSPLEDLVVLAAGRQKPLLTHARETGVLLLGTSSPGGRDPLAFYLAALFRLEPFQSIPCLTPAPELSRAVFGGKEAVSLADVFAARDDMVALVEEFQSLSRPDLQQAPSRAAALAADELAELSDQIMEFFGKASRLNDLAADFRFIPMPAAQEGEWLTAEEAEAAAGGAGAEVLRPALAAYQRLEGALGLGDPAAVRAAAEDLKTEQRKLAAALDAPILSPGLVRLELLYYAVDVRVVGLAIFAACTLLFLLLATWKGKAAAWVAYAALAAGILWNTWIAGGYTAMAGRLPLRNLQEVYLVVLFFVPLIGLFLAALFRSGVYAGAASFLSVIGFIGSLFLPAEGYMVAPLVAILHSPWRQVHILTIMFSYAVLLVACGMHAGFLGLVLFARRARSASGGAVVYSPLADELNRRAYHLVAWGFLFLTIGIATGAAWGHSAWGRYWGWDPKEVWATIAWAIYALFLHLRRFYRVPREVLACISIVGYAAILFTYFGVSYLLPGLHAYR